ncbi:MAG: DUF3108 domain-containing protein [Polyangiaceae bacterium]
MKRLPWFAAAAALALLPQLGCQYFFPTPIEQEAAEANATPAPNAIRSVGTAFLPGEVMKADVYLDSIVVGRGELRAVKACDAKGVPAVRVELEAESVGVGKLLKTASIATKSLVQLDTGTPISGWGDTVIGDERTIVESLFYPSRFQYQQTRTVKEKEQKPLFGEVALPIEGIPHDAESVLGYVRNWHPPDGTTGWLYTVSGRYAWRAQLTFVGGEVLSTERGEEKALRIEGIAQKLSGKNLTPSSTTSARHFTIWFSDDERHAPLRILLETAVAKITIELTSYAREEVKDDPSAPCEPLFDEKTLVDKVGARKKQREQDKQKAAEAKPSKPAKPAKPRPAPREADEDKDEKDAVDKIIK